MNLKMCISTEIASIFPVPILCTPIQKINDIYCYNPMFHTKNNLVITVMHIYIIIINVLFYYYFKNSNEFFLNASDLILLIAIVYVVGLV